MLEHTVKILGAVAACCSIAVGGYNVWEKYFPKKPILEWYPEYFSVTSAKATEEIYVTVAREKLRNDCDVNTFHVEVKDSSNQVHAATPSLTKFSGPANSRVDKFAYTVKINDPSKVSKGSALILAQITYKCPEGEVVVHYPDTPNLAFTIN